MAREHREKILIHSEEDRQKLLRYIAQMPLDQMKLVTIGDVTRSELQSRKLHAICGDVAKQVQWMGRWRDQDQWKVLLISGHATATKIGAELVPGLEGEIVNIRESSANMTVKRMASLLEYTNAWCAENEVKLSAPKWLLNVR